MAGYITVRTSDPVRGLSFAFFTLPKIGVRVVLISLQWDIADDGEYVELLPNVANVLSSISSVEQSDVFVDFTLVDTLQKVEPITSQYIKAKIENSGKSMKSLDRNKNYQSMFMQAMSKDLRGMLQFLCFVCSRTARTLETDRIPYCSDRCQKILERKISPVRKRRAIEERRIARESRSGGSGSVWTVRGGAFESNRRRH